MLKQKLFALVTGMALTGCGHLGMKPLPGRPVGEVAGESSPKTLRVLDAPSPLKSDREIPVLAPAEVLTLYVPSRVDRERDLLIDEHWIFVKLRDPRWFVEKLGEEPPAQGLATGEELKPLREINYKPMLIPYQKP